MTIRLGFVTPSCYRSSMNGRRREPLRHNTTSHHGPNPFPNADDIAARAHELFIGGGRQLKRIHEYWNQAEHELLNAATARAIPRSSA